MTHINSLWIGEKLTDLESMSIVSHLKNGHSYTLWSYKNLKLPHGAISGDANQILEEKEVFSYKKGEGKGSFSAFSNVFRYKLLLERGGWWCDTDVIALKNFKFSSDYVFASEVNKNGSIIPTTCVIKTPPGSDIMKLCYEFASKINKDNVEWGEIGPHLLASKIYELNLHEYVCSFSTFCPVSWFDSENYPPVKKWKLKQDTVCVHLWQEMWRRSGLDKNGNYPNSLYERLRFESLCHI